MIDQKQSVTERLDVNSVQLQVGMVVDALVALGVLRSTPSLGPLGVAFRANDRANTRVQNSPSQTSVGGSDVS